jgi:DnaD/phage-associated family protein
MSIQAQQRVWKYSQAKGLTKLTFIAIADHSNVDNLAWPSVKFLAVKTGISERQIIRCIRKLEGLGELIVLRDRSFNRYVVNLPELQVTNEKAMAHDTMTSNDVTQSRDKVTEGDREDPEGDIQDIEGDSLSLPGDSKAISHDIGSDKPLINHNRNHKFKSSPEPPKIADAEIIIKKSNIFKLYENNIGSLTPLISEKLKLAEQEYPNDWFEPAFTSACEHNARNWRYIVTILERWKNTGFDGDRKNGGRNSKQSYKDFAEEFAEEIVHGKRRNLEREEAHRIAGG